MSFYVLKVAWWMLQPSSLIAASFIIGAILRLNRRMRTGNRLIAFGILAYLAAGFSPAGNWLLIPLEAAFQKAPEYELQSAAGIIVLGGAVETVVSPGQGPQLNEAAERMSEAVTLANRLPALMVVFSGGKGETVYSETSEAEVARQYFAGFNILPPRLRLENRSRNTLENAKFSAGLLRPASSQKWVLVTSAFHMARAKALFEAQGFQILPWPVDYRTRGEADILRFFPQASEGLRRVDLGAREWASMLFLWARNEIPWPFPPSNPAQPS